MDAGTGFSRAFSRQYGNYRRPFKLPYWRLVAGIVVSLVLDAVQGIDPLLILPLIALADRARNDSGQAWPSIADIAARSARSPRQAKRDMAALELAGLITRKLGGGRGHTTMYTINLPLLRTLIHRREKVTPLCHPLATPQKVTNGAQRVTPEVIKGDIAVSPELLEPLLTSTGVGVDVDLQSRARTATPNPEGEKGLQVKTGTPPRPAHGRGDEQGIEALARYFKVWPLNGEPGRDWGIACTFVNRLREEHFRKAKEPAVASTIRTIIEPFKGVQRPPQRSLAEQLEYVRLNAKEPRK